MANFTLEEAHLLLHNKFVVILGDSIQRTVYKDLVVFLQTESCLTNTQLRSKGELSFEGDQLVEGGKLSNNTDYREVRQYHSPSHLLRFYFLTRIYSNYVESVLADFQTGLQPDVLIVNSCVWDISRYGSNSIQQYRENLDTFFTRLNEVLLPECLVIWNMTMPLGKKIKGGFLIPELQYLDVTLRCDVIEANFYSALLADAHGFDVLDLHYQFRFHLQHRAADGIHWNKVVHRRITFTLLQHIAEAWGVSLSPHPHPHKPQVPLEFVWRNLPVTGPGLAAPVQWERRGLPRIHASEMDFFLDRPVSREGDLLPGFTASNSNTNCPGGFGWRDGDGPRLQPQWLESANQTELQLRGSNNLVMRNRLSHSRIPAPYGWPDYRHGHC
ncbi:PC-esterase domain-containing protein 1A isoform X2 [Scyliorhinus torazame]|uniref:PC-esterase domain-containing protein 1A isoform X2 n=1 Tax=Scyliorhinus torazame TaxID=75743 RepID=UPI003B59F3CD